MRAWPNSGKDVSRFFTSKPPDGADSAGERGLHVTQLEEVDRRVKKLDDGNPFCCRYSERNASVTSTRAARPAGKIDAMTAAAISKNTEAAIGRALGVCNDGK